MLIRIDCANWHKAESEPQTRSKNNALALELEPVAGRHENREQFLTRKPESALAIRDVNVADSPNLPGHELICPPADERHRFQIAHPVANHQVSVRAIDGIDKRGNLRRIMLPIRVKKQEERNLNRDCVP